MSPKKDFLNYSERAKLHLESVAKLATNFPQLRVISTDEFSNRERRFGIIAELAASGEFPGGQEVVDEAMKTAANAITQQSILSQVEHKIWGADHVEMLDLAAQIQTNATSMGGNTSHYFDSTDPSHFSPETEAFIQSLTGAIQRTTGEPVQQLPYHIALTVQFK